MRTIDFQNLTGNDLLDHSAISAAFKNYLMETLEYNEDEADFVIKTDFVNPYDTPFIMQDCEGKATIDGKTYEVRSCYTDFCACGLFHLAGVDPFEFYMLFDLDDVPNNTVGEYRKATKLYLL